MVVRYGGGEEREGRQREDEREEGREKGGLCI